jgi:hypothetical protein
MGLLYPFPATAQETDFVRIEQTSGRITTVAVRTYGLPYLFWGYAFASMVVVLFLWLAVRAPLAKLALLGDDADRSLVLGLEIFLATLPLGMLGFLFYEKRLVHSPGTLKIQHRLFGVPIRSRELAVPERPFVVDHFIDAPNVARLRGGEESRGFQNKGYFTLWSKTLEEELVLVDRHSRKADLLALQALLNSVSEAVDRT